MNFTINKRTKQTPASQPASQVTFVISHFEGCVTQATKCHEIQPRKKDTNSHKTNTSTGDDDEKKIYRDIKV